MKMLCILLIFALCAIPARSVGPIKVILNITELEYKSMPPLFHLDDFDGCLTQKSDSLYCFATVQLVPKDVDNLSKTWKIIEEVITVPRFYRHDRLRHGICVQETCPNIPKANYGLGNGTEELWKGISDCYSHKYDHLGLRSEVTEINCQNDQPVYEIDSLDIAYICTLLTFLALVTIGTTFEVRARYKKPEEYERITSSSKARKLLTAFSLTKNLERLGSEITSEDGLALSPIQGIRVFNMFFVIMTHTCMLEFLGPLANPQFVENTTLKPANMFLSNGSLIMQTSFITSAFLLSFNITQIFENKKVSLLDIINAIFIRIARLYPILIMMIGFASTLLRHTGSGPFFNLIIDVEYKNCRNNWLLNILFINNMYKPGEMCLPQTWYLAADSQLFLLGLLTMMAVINKPEYAKKIFASIFALGISITFIQHYYNAYDIVFRSYPEMLYTLNLKMNQWLRMFIATQHHIPCYILGLAGGYYFHKYRKYSRKYTNFFRVSYVFFFVLPIGAILSAAPTYNDGFETSRFNAALYHALSRVCFGLPILIGMLGFFLGYGGPMRKFINWRPFHVLGRLSFTVYLSHLHFMRMNRGIDRNMSFLTERVLIRWVFGDILISYLLGAVLCLLIELPTSAILNILMSIDKKKDNKVKSHSS
ncbi:PREDICTED: uncharacterized protein LOC108559241 [Nicrophorus vespilloides]|uniref:Uncharacterized protein LOC108559241 n=1 Tax=Nicrophorus vespilloides TaxID=110193 RepID=A0ABM1MBJ1_NICVS|nr:PREDICTED: uncharacterized protein LOC108559241 [Nicrophorus vespilloides]